MYRDDIYANQMETVVKSSTNLQAKMRYLDCVSILSALQQIACLVVRLRTSHPSYLTLSTGLVFTYPNKEKDTKNYYKMNIDFDIDAHDETCTFSHQKCKI